MRVLHPIVQQVPKYMETVRVTISLVKSFIILAVVVVVVVFVISQPVIGCTTYLSLIHI